MRFAPAQHYRAGCFQDSQGERQPVVSPLTGEPLSEVPLATAEEVSSTVDAARQAFGDWASRTLRDRAKVMFSYRSLLESHLGELSELIHLENGKTVGEARAEVIRAIEVTEFACSLPQLATGDVLEVSSGVRCQVERVPLGVVASVTPFNFPAMVPHWTIPIAITLGNTFILKPSETVPLTAGRTAELLQAAGLPAGVFNVLHGGRPVVEALCDHADVQAITFVGSTPAAKNVYVRATGNLKRALCLGGAKNHLIVLPDAAVEKTAENVVASMAGCAGQRCMAAANLLAVGSSEPVIDAICRAAGRLTPGETLGPVISAAAKQRIEGYIAQAVEQGAQLLVDGRGTVVPAAQGGFYLGPTVLDHVRPEMDIAKQEVFGPVLCIIRVGDVDEAIAVENASPYGNACAIYSQSGGLARDISSRVSVGMVGINIGVPVPLEPFGFGGWNQSRFGVGDITGKSSLEFWTQSRKITSRWHPETHADRLTS